MQHGRSRTLQQAMLITGWLSPSTSSQLVTVINTVINRPVNNSGILHGTLICARPEITGRPMETWLSSACQRSPTVRPSHKPGKVRSLSHRFLENTKYSSRHFSTRRPVCGRSRNPGLSTLPKEEEKATNLATQSSSLSSFDAPLLLLRPR